MGKHTLECGALTSNVLPRSHEAIGAPAGLQSTPRPAAPNRDDSPASFSTVAEEVFRRYGRNWKPGTMVVNQAYLRNQILPWFRERSIEAVTHRDVCQWFASLHAKPAAANRSLPVLSIILRQAEVYGYRPVGPSPCAGIRRYRCPGRQRFLTETEYARLAASLEEWESMAPPCAALVRLLLLTGCRQSEIRTLEWREYSGRHLHLRDSKTGARTVWLSDASRAILDSLVQTGRFVFPAADGETPLKTEALYTWWRRVREGADLPGLRLHDLRHSYASFALQRGETVPTIARLLGHSDPTTTTKYTHFADAAMRHAGELVGEVLGVPR